VRTADILTAATLILLGGVVMVDAVRLGVGWSTDGPQSGFFPFWLAVVLMVTSGLVLTQAARRRSPRPFVTRQQVGPLLKVLGPAAALIVLTQLIGLYVAAALYAGLCMRWIGRYRWPAVLLLAIGFPLVTFLVFERWFLVPMPKGPLEHWLGY
jgi:putative tricarboxylic transport membrane protein